MAITNKHKIAEMLGDEWNRDYLRIAEEIISLKDSKFESILKKAEGYDAMKFMVDEGNQIISRLKAEIEELKRDKKEAYGRK